MEESVKSNFFKKFKAIASTAYTSPKRFFRKSSKPGHGNLLLITSTVKVELSKLNFNFDDIRTYFVYVLRDCRQIAFVILNGFCPLSKKYHLIFLTDNSKMDRILTKTIYILFQVLKVLLIKICRL